MVSHIIFITGESALNEVKTKFFGGVLELLAVVTLVVEAGGAPTSRSISCAALLLACGEVGNWRRSALRFLGDPVCSMETVRGGGVRRGGLDGIGLIDRSNCKADVDGTTKNNKNY